MKIVGYTALRYGKDYLAYAIRSIIDYISEYHVLYATIPSHGHYSDLPCPDSEEELYAIAQQAAGSKLYWHRGNWRMEGEQRNSIYEYAPDADVIISCDSDELFSKQLLNNIMDYASRVTYQAPFRYLRVPFVHLYRNFNHTIVHDPAFPARVIFPRIDAKYGDFGWTANKGSVAHLGYCQRAEMIRYKMKIHGHASEFRCSADEYVDGIYLNEDRWTDLHPIGSQYWNAEEINPFNYLPDWMINHPNYGKQIVK